MRTNSLRIIIVLGCCMALAAPLLAVQRASDPITGRWSGDWGPNAGDRNTVNVD